MTFKKTGVFLATLALCSFLVTFSQVTRATNVSPWAAPQAMAIRKISASNSTQSQPNFLSNLDCTLLSYRTVVDKTMQNGCFSNAAFGMVDTDSGRVIFNGTDEAIDLVPYNGKQVLIPWPGALNLLAAETAVTGGSYLSMYKNPLANFDDQRNYLGQLTGKHLKTPPELPLTDEQGSKLLVNLQTLAFSDGGSWMAVETLSGAFIRINLATLDQTAFAQAFGQLGSPATLKSTVAITGDGRQSAIANQIDESLKVYDLTNCTNGVKYDNCQSYNYWPYLKQKLPGLYNIRGLRFINNNLIKFEAWSSTTEDNGTYLLAPSSTISTLADYLALGDSYTSGEGAFNYRTGTDTTENRCHSSVHAYPELLTRELFTAAGGHSVACAGAVINDIGNKSPKYRGQVRDVLDFEGLQSQQPALLTSVLLNHIPGYIAQHRFVSQDQPRIVSVSIGGNDIGFGDIVASCVIPQLSVHMSDNTCFNTYEDRLEVIRLIDRTVPRWTSLFRQLQKESPLSNIYAIGYPDIISDQGSCALNVHLNQSEREFAKELLVYLNDGIQRAAQDAKIKYTDISNALAGHRLCEAASHSVAVNGVTAGTDAGVLGMNIIGSESYHPNALGHILIAQEILRQTNNFTTEPLVRTPTSNADKFLNKPKTNRPVRVRIPAKITPKKIVKKKDKIRITVNGPRHGLKPGSPYKIILGGVPLPVGEIISSPDGLLDGAITIPDTAPGGGNIVDIIGDSQNGEPIVITEPILIVDNPSDSDRDGISDPVDACPTLANSGVDFDSDGIDDTCDPVIGFPTTTAPGSPSQDGGIVTPGGSAGNISTAAPNGIALKGNSVSLEGENLGRGNVQSTGKAVLGSKAHLLQGNLVTGNGLNPQDTIAQKYLPKLPLNYIPWIYWCLLIIIVWWVILLIYLLGRRLVLNYKFNTVFKPSAI